MKIAITYLVLLALLVACAGNTPTETPSDAQDAAQDGPNADETADAKDEFESYFTKSNLQWKIAYDLKSNAGGEEMTSQMTQYMKGETRFRTDMAYEGMESRVYVVDETFTMCTKQNNDWSCFKSEPSEDDATVDTQEWEEEYETNEENYRITSDGTKTVAGVSTKCFKVSEITNTDAIVRYCFASDGAPLYIYMSDDDYMSEMTATSYSKTVSDSDFTPPAEAQDIGAMYGGAGGTSPAGGESCSYCTYLTGADRDNCLASC